VDDDAGGVDHALERRPEPDVELGGSRLFDARAEVVRRRRSNAGLARAKLAPNRGRAGAQRVERGRGAKRVSSARTAGR
jgi:hypothetical protein